MLKLCSLKVAILDGGQGHWTKFENSNNLKIKLPELIPQMCIMQIMNIENLTNIEIPVTLISPKK
jgi:ABC-type polysaccharide transport system permease subunit